jgi:O-antigen ligase
MEGSAVGAVDHFILYQIAMVVVLIIGPAVVIRPELALGVFPFMALLKTSPVFGDPRALYPVIVLLLLMLAGTLLSAARAEAAPQARADWAWWPLGIFVFWAAVPPWVRHLGLTDQTVLALRLLFYTVPFFVVIAGLGKGGHASFQRMFRCMMWVGGSLSAVLCVASLGLLPGLPVYQLFRQNPIPVAWAAGITLTTMVALRASDLELSRTENVATLVFAVTASLSLVLLRQRGPAFSAGLTVLMVSLLARRRFRAAAAVLLFGAVVAAFFMVTAKASDLLARFTFSRASGYSASMEERRVLYSLGLKNFLSRPLTGIGLGEGASLANGGYAYVHNIFIEVLSELGLVGFAFFAVVPVLTPLRALRVIRGQGSPWRGIMLVCLSGFAFYFLCAQTSANLEGNRGVWWFAALVWVVHSRARPQNGSAVEEDAPRAGELDVPDGWA